MVLALGSNLVQVTLVPYTSLEFDSRKLLIAYLSKYQPKYCKCCQYVVLNLPYLNMNPNSFTVIPMSGYH